MTIQNLPFDPNQWLKRGRPDPRLPAADIESLQTALFDAARLLRTSVALLRHNLTPQERELVLDSLVDRAIAIDLAAFSSEVKSAVLGETNDFKLGAYSRDPDGAA